MGRPTRREFDGPEPLTPTRFNDLASDVTTLEDTVAGNGEDLRTLRDILEKHRESYEGFKRTYAEDRHADSEWRRDMAKELGRVAGAMESNATWVKVVAGLAAAALAALVALVALAVKH